MIKEIKMPNLGTTTDEMKITEWFKKENEPVKRGEPLFAVETDKATMEVESYLSGVLKKIVVIPDEIVKTGGIVAYVGDEKDVFEEMKNEGLNDIFKEVAAIEKKEDSVRISPMVKKIAEKLNVDYRKISGSGINGMITKEDIENAVKDLASAQNIVKFDRIGKAIAKAMTLSKTTIPHVYFDIEVNASEMMEVRKRSDKNISFNTLIIKAVADGIKEFPYIAAKYSDEGRILADKINIGLAVAREDDLLVPVVYDVINVKDIYELEKKIVGLTDKVKDGTLEQKEITGGVFTVTNLGSYGVDSFSAVINPPEAAILAIGRITDKAVVVNGEISIQPMMKMTLSVDHRIINGTYAAKFLQALKRILERK